jgi:pyrroline-5-carboxylate reductase
MQSRKMAFIGAGKMAEAILGGLPPVNWGNTVACDYSAARVRVFRERFGISVLPDGADAVKDADVVSGDTSAYGDYFLLGCSKAEIPSAATR